MTFVSPFSAFYETHPSSLTKEEWAREFQTAGELLLPSRSAYKIWRRGKQKNRQRNYTFFRLPTETTLTHSFFKFNNDVYATLPHGSESFDYSHSNTLLEQTEQNPAFAGSGAYVMVKYAINQLHQRFVIKMQRKDRLSSTRSKRIKDGFLINQDIGLLLGYWSRITNGQERVYQLEPYLGENLQILLSNYSASFSERLNISIQLIWQVHQLHRGHLSKTGTGYAHRDIKPDNIVCNPETMRVSLVDFGFATTELDKLERDFKGTLHFAPVLPSLSSPRKHDFLSLKRVINFPRRFTEKGGTHYKLAEDDRCPYAYLFTKEELDRLEVYDLFNTNDNGIQSRQSQRALTQHFHAPLYAASLIYATLTLNLGKQFVVKMRQDVAFSEAIIALYFSNTLSAKNLSTLQRSETCSRLHSDLAVFALSLPISIREDISTSILSQGQSEILTHLNSLRQTPGDEYWICKTLDSLNDFLSESKLRELLLNFDTLDRAVSYLKRGEDLMAFCESKGLTTEKTGDAEEKEAVEPNEHTPFSFSTQVAPPAVALASESPYGSVNNTRSEKYQRLGSHQRTDDSQESFCRRYCGC